MKITLEPTTCICMPWLTQTPLRVFRGVAENGKPLVIFGIITGYDEELVNSFALTEEQTEVISVLDALRRFGTLKQ